MPRIVRSSGKWLTVLALLLAFSSLQVTAQEKEPPKPEQPRKDPGRAPGGLDVLANVLQLMQRRQMQRLERRRGAMSNASTTRSDSRLGVRLEQPGEAVADQLDLPRGVGLVLSEVVAGSAAEKAGLKPNDILLELDGKPVASDLRDFVKDLNDVKADTAVEAVVLRRGKRETVRGLTLPEAPTQALPANPNDPNVPRVRVPLLLPDLGDPPNRRVPNVPAPLPLPLP